MQNVEIKELENSEVEICASIEPLEYEKYKEDVLKRLGASMDIPGFRKGNIPADVIEKKIGEVSLLQEMASEAISEIYPKIIEEKKIHAIGRPEITITKMAKGNPIEFKAKTAVLPEMELPDYKAIAGGVPEEKVEDVSDEELEKVITEIRTNWAHQMEQVKNAGKDPKEGEEKEGEKKAPELPELTDEFVKNLGAFENVADFKEKLKQNMGEEKKGKAQEKRRITIVDKILEKITFTPPQVLIDGELQRMLAQFKDNLAMMGQKPEDYFKQIKKTEDEVTAGWKDDAVKRVKMQLALSKIAQKENITIPEDELAKETKAVMEKYPDVKEDHARGYVENILLNEKTFAFLEKA